MKLSACMIVKNEIDSLPECLDSIHDYVDEIVVVDTGSTDGTQFFVKHYSDKIVFDQIEWDDDFSAARNHAMSLTTGDWLFTIDADDRVIEGDWPIVKRVLMSDEYDCIVVDILSVYGDRLVVRSRLRQPRFFKSSLGPRYTGKVHNQAGFHKKGIDDVERAVMPFRIIHIGYGGIDPGKLAEKNERVVRMCKQATEDDPTQAFVWHNYAVALRNAGYDKLDHKEFHAVCDKSIECAIAKQDHMRLMGMNMKAWAHYAKREYGDAILWAKRATGEKPDYIDAVLLLGYVNADTKDMDEAEFYLKKYLNLTDRYSVEDSFDGITMEQIDRRAVVYKALAAIELYKEEHGLKLGQLLGGKGETHGNV